MGSKTYTNGIILGIAFAVLVYYAASSIEWLSFVPSIVTAIGDFLAGFAWFPQGLATWEYFDYTIVAFIGLIIGYIVESR